MAGSYVSLVMQTVRGIDPTCKLVLVVLADCANVADHGLTFPAVATVAERAGVDRRTAQRCLRELETAGWLLVEQASKGGYGRTTRYRLNLAKMRAVSRENSGGGDAVNSGTDDAVEPVHNLHNCGTDDAVVAKSPDKNRGTGVTHTAAKEARNRVTGDARSFEPELNQNLARTHAPAREAVSLRSILNGNRNPLKSGKGQRQPENTEGAPPAAPRPAMSQAEQVAYVQRALAGKAVH